MEVDGCLGTSDGSSSTRTFHRMRITVGYTGSSVNSTPNLRKYATSLEVISIASPLTAGLPPVV